MSVEALSARVTKLLLEAEGLETTLSQHVWETELWQSQHDEQAPPAHIMDRDAELRPPFEATLHALYVAIVCLIDAKGLREYLKQFYSAIGEGFNGEAAQEFGAADDWPPYPRSAYLSKLRLFLAPLGVESGSDVYRQQAGIKCLLPRQAPASIAWRALGVCRQTHYTVPSAACSNLWSTTMESNPMARSPQMASDKSAPLLPNFFAVVRPIRNLAPAAFMLASSFAFAGEPSLLTSISGLWQFAENNVWIQIDEKGAAYQCRIGREGTVFSASGSFVSPNSIEWQNIWGTDTLTLTSGTLILKGRFGEFKHHRASTPMSPACLPMRQRGGVTT